MDKRMATGVPAKVLRHAWDLVEYMDYDLPIILGMDLDLRDLSVLIADQRGHLRAGAATLVGTAEGNLAILIKPKISNPSSKSEEPAPAVDGGETA